MRVSRVRRQLFGTSHWSFLFGEIAIYSFAVLAVTGLFLMMFFDPDMSRVTYDGGYAPLRGVQVSAAFDSAMRISFEVTGGLFIRQVHHWAALIFAGAVMLQLLRMFLTGAFRRPRHTQWMIWVTLLVLAMAAGETGKILPDDLLSGGSLWLIDSIVLSIPVVGTYLHQLLFGGAFPGEDIVPRLYWVHVLVLPLLVAGLLVVRARLVRRHGHTRFPGAVAGRPSARTLVAGATVGVLVMLGALFQITPIWLYGPANPAQTAAGAVPDWYMGFIDGALRLMPAWEVTVFGHTLSLVVLVPGLVVPGAFFTVLALYPLIEERVTLYRTRRDLRGRPMTKARMARARTRHDVLDRPRATPVRTGLAAAGVTFYGLLWASAANDQIAHVFHLSLESVTNAFRVAVVLGPFVAFVITRRLCLGLQARDRGVAGHGVETGVIVRTPEGGYHETHRFDEARAIESTAS
ncbi:cytochrome b N-terminal domain-containing protein [Nonomuraea sp. NPDC049152]|uniref:cytochrome bc1 complex cytochrome b subunit n=1 Tax=Nonomuraea sp. NPDC049152 TaxID=3154350 RepID=UPI00340FAF99